MKNTVENRLKFIAQYFGQRLFNYSHVKDRNELAKSIHVDHNCLTRTYVSQFSYLELKSLSNISDEDARKLVKLKLQFDITGDNTVYNPGEIKAIDVKVQTGDEEHKAYIEAEITHTKFANWMEYLLIGRPDDKAIIVDKLRLMGYAVPYDTLSVETLIKYGWVRIL